MGTHTFADLEGGDGAVNAGLIYDVFAGRGTAANRDAIVASAGAMFYLYDKAEDFREGADLARELIDAGTVAEWLRTHEEANYGG